MQLGITKAKCNHSIHELHFTDKFKHNFSQSTNMVLAKNGMAKAIQTMCVISATLVSGNNMHSILYLLLPFLILFSNLLSSFSFHPSLPSYDYFLCQYSFFITPFSPFPPSVGSNCSISTVEVDGTYVNLEIWDTAGQERFAYMAPLYYRRAQAAIVVYDITDKVHTCIAIIAMPW